MSHVGSVWHVENLKEWRIKMGGGGGGPAYWPSIKDAEQKAREILDRARTRRNLFISFSSYDLKVINLFRAQSKNDNSDIEFIDRSVHKPYRSVNDAYIKQKISQRIRQCSMTVVYLTDNSANSDWVDWEIKRSIQLGKKVVAFHKGDTPPRVLPNAVKENKIKVFSWSSLPNELE